MDEDQNNPNPQPKPDNSSIETNTPLEEKEAGSSKQSIEPDVENLSSKDSETTKKNRNIGKSLFVFFLLFITLCIGSYFYIDKEGINLASTLPENLKKLFLITPKIKNAHENESKERPIRPNFEIAKKVGEVKSPETQMQGMAKSPSEEIVEKIKEEKFPEVRFNETPSILSGKKEGHERPNHFEKKINGNEKTIALLRDEIKSLKEELKQKPSNHQKVLTSKQQTDGSLLEESNETNQKKENEVMSKFDQHNDIQKKSPQRSKEVQAYLDFVEKIGERLLGLIKKGWFKLKTLVIKFIRNNEVLKRFKLKEIR